MSALLLLLSVAASAAAPSVSILSASPAGPASAGAEPEAVVVVFDQPMVALASPADMGRACPLKLSPSVAGRCRWRGTQTLAFEPERPLPPAASFRATVPAGTRSAVTGAALAAERSWTFETRRPQLLDSRPQDGDRWIAPDATLFLHFDMTMDPKRARGAVVLREAALDSAEPGEELAAGVRRATPEEVKAAWPWSWGEAVPSSATVLAVKPSRPLRRDRAYRLTLKADLRAADGELGLSSERTVRFEAPYSFKLVDGPGRACLPRGYAVSFTNPVVHGELVAHLRVEGSTRSWDAEGRRSRALGERDPERRRVAFHLGDLGFEPDRSYTLVVSSDLADAFGQPLGAEVRVPFSNDGLCPRLSMPQQFGVLEQGLPARHPVTAVNVPTAPLRKGVVADEAFIPFYRGISWGCRDRLAFDAPEKPWDLGLPRNRSLRTFVDLAPAFAAARPPRSGGLAAVEVTGPGDCRQKAVLDVTRVGLHLKSSPDSTLVWATYLKSAAPAAGVPVELRSDDNKVLWRGVTNRDGLADAPGWKGLGLTDWKRWSRPNLWAFAKDPKGTAVLSLDWRGGVEPWRFDVMSDWAPRPRHYRVSLFTERGVYRSGETVRVKAIARKLEGGDWRALGAGDPRTLVLTVKDPRGAEVVRTTATLSDLSSLDASFALRDSAPTGHWTVRLREPGAKDDDLVRPAVDGEEEGGGEDEAPVTPNGEVLLNAAKTFRVEAFKPAAFEVKAVPAAPSWLAGDAYQASIEGWWLFGAPMAGEKAAWSLRLEPSAYEPPGWPGFSFAPAWRKRRAETGRLLASGEAGLDAKGRASATAVLDPGDALGPLNAAFEASVVSPERQRLFARASGVVHRADLYYGVKSESNFIELGQRWDAAAAAVRPDGRRAETLGASWSLRRREWLSVERAGVAGRLEWVSEERETLVSSGTFAASASTWTWSATPDKPGEYEFSLSGRDEKGRPAETVREFNVAGAGEAWWKRKDDDIVEIVADKDSYKPGETARLLVKSPYEKASALVTVEREGVIARWTQTLKGGASLVRVPLDDR
ncbi:MAG: hypothetical protein HY079_07230, partial [Elusimicrobia bacterium]|nr:hypothetical protein [Elusimicrobiota bacterium]